MDFRLRALSFLLLGGVACSSTPPPENPRLQTIALGGRVSVVAVEATSAARRADQGTTAAAVGLLAALGRPEDNISVVLYGAQAGALLPVTTLAARRVRPAALVEKLDTRKLPGAGSTVAALERAKESLQFFEDVDDSAVVWIGATPPDDESGDLKPTLELFGGRNWRILLAPTAEVLASRALDDMASSTRGARFKTRGGTDLLRGVLELGADMNVLFRRIEPTTGPVRAPATARRLLFVSLPDPGADLLGANPADETGAPVWPKWVRRPAEGEPPYRVLELSDPRALASFAWVPKSVGSPKVTPYAELPMRVSLSQGAPPVEVAAGSEIPVTVVVELAENAKELVTRLTAEAQFGGGDPVLLRPQTSAPGTLNYAAPVAVPDGLDRPVLQIRLRVDDPDAGKWEWTRNVTLRATGKGISPLTIDPPEFDLGPQWDDQPADPSPIVLRTESPITVTAEPLPAVVALPAELKLAPGAGAKLALSLSPTAPLGPFEAPLTIRVRDEAGTDLARRSVLVKGAVFHWEAPELIDLGTQTPGGNAEAVVTQPWAPYTGDGAAAGTLATEDGAATLPLEVVVEETGDVRVAVTVPEDAAAGTYTGSIECRLGETLAPRTIPVTFVVSKTDVPIPPDPTEPLEALPNALALSGNAGGRLEAELELKGVSAEKPPARMEISNLIAEKGDDVISARFDCALELIHPAEGRSRLAVRVAVPGDVAPGRYRGQVRLWEKPDSNPVIVDVEIDVP
jgi:hypothetical protein